jgi:hypothetical protein
MGSLVAILKNPDEFYPLLKLKMAARHAEKQIPREPHWGFCYTMLQKVSRSFAMVIQQLDSNLRNAVSPKFKALALFYFLAHMCVVLLLIMMVLVVCGSANWMIMMVLVVMGHVIGSGNLWVIGILNDPGM